MKKIYFALAITLIVLGVVGTIWNRFALQYDKSHFTETCLSHYALDGNGVTTCTTNQTMVDRISFVLNIIFFFAPSLIYLYACYRLWSIYPGKKGVAHCFHLLLLYAVIALILSAPQFIQESLAPHTTAVWNLTDVQFISLVFFGFDLAFMGVLSCVVGLVVMKRNQKHV